MVLVGHREAMEREEWADDRKILTKDTTRILSATRSYGALCATNFWRK
jgi:hypothetical protein